MRKFLKPATKKILMTVAAIIGVALLAGIIMRNLNNERGVFAGVISDMQQIIGIK